MSENDVVYNTITPKEDPLIIFLGLGTIFVGTAGFPDEDCDRELVFAHQYPPRQIGSKCDPDDIGKSTEEKGCFLRLQFKNTEAIDVLIEELELIKTSMATHTKIKYLHSGQEKR